MRLIEKLSGGDMRSTGNSDKVVIEILKQPERFGELVDAMQNDNPIVRMRAADAAEKISVTRSDLLQPYKKVLLKQIAAIPQQEVRWHVCQMLPRLKLTRAERRRAFDLLKTYLDDKSGIVRTFSMQAMYDLATQDPTLRNETRALLEKLTATGTPAMKSRGKKLLSKFPQE
jgi:hypothetical protein